MKGLIDSTLREGGQMVGVHFGLADKLAIAAQLDRLGVEEIELGVATSLDPDLANLVAGCRAAGTRARLALWCRCLREDIDFAARLAPEVLSLSIPASDLHITKKLGKDRAWVLATVKWAIGYAQGQGVPFLSLGLEDATRADQDFLGEIALVASDAGVQRLRLADTVGIATPGELAELVGGFKARFHVEIGVHCHNDFGMATANSLTALATGADWADVTVLGLGERAGNARLEEVVGYLALRAERPYQVSGLKKLSGLVSRLAGQPISPHQPLIGERIFHCESGLHLQGLAADPLTYEPYQPELVGAERRLLYGAKIGRGQVRDGLAKVGRQLNAPSLTKLIHGLRCHSTSPNLPSEEREFNELLVRLS